MHILFNIFNIKIPAYGLMIATGVILSNIIVIAYILKKYFLDINNFLILEAYCFLGGFLGAKLLYLIVSYKAIDWSQILNYKYFNALMQSGFVFYGGLIGGLIFVICGGKIHHINYKTYIQHCIFLIPFIHGFGRIGCFMAGCCYGIPYDGPFAVTFPINSLAPSNISLFPIQPVEAICLFIISFVIIKIDTDTLNMKTLFFYLISYGILRFILEFLRYDSARGKFFLLSTSQWISVLMIISCIIYILINSKRQRSQNSNSI